jgi:hypothetical protein
MVRRSSYKSFPNPNRPTGVRAAEPPNIDSLSLRRADPSINARFKGLMYAKTAECVAAHDENWFYSPNYDNGDGSRGSCIHIVGDRETNV